MRSGGCTEKANTSDLIEYTAADFNEKLHAGKMMFIYFEHQGMSFYSHSSSDLKPLQRVMRINPLSIVSPTVSLFLLELEKSAEALQDYGVLVGKVALVPMELNALDNIKVIYSPCLIFYFR